MYKYINNYPEDRENGWSEEAQGVCHDKNFWYFTQNGNLWKFPVFHDLNDTCKKPNPSKDILCHYTKGLHLGDMDYYNEYLFIATEKNGSIDFNNVARGPLSVFDLEKEAEYLKKTEARILIFRAKDLAYVRSVKMKRMDGKQFNCLAWLAINPKNGLLYTSDHHISNEIDYQSAPIHVYSIGDIADKEMLTLHSTLNLYDEQARALRLIDMQGGCFDNDNYLHLICGDVTNKNGLNPSKSNLDNFRHGISVFKVKQNIAKGESCKAYRVAHSNQSSGFRYQFNGTGDEPEGITYWDLDIDDKRPLFLRRKKITKSDCFESPNIKGQLHAIMLNNAGTGDDDLFFKHYKREDYSEFYRVIMRMGDCDGAGTDGDVYITLIGEHGAWGEIELNSPLDDFERGTVNHFIIEVNHDIGNINQINIKRRNKDEMFLKNVTIISISHPEKQWTFEFNKWI